MYYLKGNRLVEHLVFFAVCGVVLFLLFLREAHNAKKKEKDFVASLYARYGKMPEKDYSLERFSKMDSYWKRHRAVDGVDDITWNDLSMDAVFKRMDYTLSATGEEYLYHTLRNTNRTVNDLKRQEEVTHYFETHPDERVKIQYNMYQLGYTKSYSLYDYLEHLEQLGERSNRRHIICNLLFLPLGALAFYDLSLALTGMAILLCYNILSYFKEKGEIEPYIICFAYIVRLINVCKKIIQTTVPVCKEEWQEIREAIRTLDALNKDSYFVFSGNKGGNTSGNPLEMLLDYGRMMFHLDLMQFNKMLHVVREHVEEIDTLISRVGYLESCISIGTFRASLKNGYCVPIFQEEKYVVDIKGLYHPLLEKPVKNSIQTDKGVLITGSNASGKSTFLKAVAINAIFAQTIHTCMATEYQAPIVRIYSSMSLKDDLESGESYYMAEIRAIKRILDATCEADNERNGAKKSPVLCFVDEVLRGTNTVERIAASTQILKSLSGEAVLCFAATHDIELTGLLEDVYNNYHFEENISDGDVYFPYKILEGKATSRNAIRLLEIMGYEESLIKEAIRRAEYFAEFGEWR